MKGLTKAQQDRAVRAAAIAWCCPDGCAYVEAKRQPECDAMTGEPWLREKIRSMLAAGLAALRADKETT